MIDVSTMRVLVIINPRSGWAWSFAAVQRALEEYWERPGADVSYQFTHNAEDAVRKVERAVHAGISIVLVAGGDGTVSTVAQALLGEKVALGAIPVGSGNGFARHFGVPLTLRAAVRALAQAEVQTIDVGVVNGRPFVVTCSVAWDAAIVRSFTRLRIRGILPYVFAGVQEFFEYRPQPMTVRADEAPPVIYPDPMVCTVANLTQYGGGAKIAPQADPADGFLELVILLRQDIPVLLANLRRLFDGSLYVLPQVLTRRFRHLVIERRESGPIQIDGELVEADRKVEVQVRPAALQVLVPRPGV